MALVKKAKLKKNESGNFRGRGPSFEETVGEYAKREGIKPASAPRARTTAESHRTENGSLRAKLYGKPISAVLRTLAVHGYTVRAAVALLMAAKPLHGVSMTTVKSRVGLSLDVDYRGEPAELDNASKAELKRVLRSLAV